MNQLSPSYYISCGKSLWESERKGAGDEAVTDTDRNRVLEPNSKPPPSPGLVGS